MESPETLFSEPYILTPYKICVANFLLSYFEEKSHQASSPIAINDNLNITSHCYLSFKLMMALDCTYSEFRVQLFSLPGYSHAVIRRFDQHLSKIKYHGIGSFYDFFLKLSRIVQRKFNTNKSNSNSNINDDLCRVHRSSVAGFFLRKLIIYFERLDYWEMSILFHQLIQYLNDRTENEQLADFNDDFMHIDQSVLKNDQQKRSKSKLKVLEPESIPIDNSTMDIDVSMELTIDNTKNDTEITLTKCPPVVDESYNFEQNLLSKLYPKEKLGHYGQATHHFLTNQLKKIMIDETNALSPPEIFDFINSYFEQHNSFHYIRLIKSNYLGNLSLVKDSMYGNSTTSYYNVNLLQAGKKPKDFFQVVNCYGDIHYLKYINALRINNVTLAEDAFYNYFDLKKARSNSCSANANGSTNSTTNSNGNSNGTIPSGSSGNFCWSVLNLAIMNVHFGQYKLAYEALTDCISVARENKEDKCLQFAMIWMLLVLQHFDQSMVEHNQKSLIPNTNNVIHRNWKPFNDISLIENLINLVLSNEKSLPYIAAMAHLHLQRMYYLRPIYSKREQTTSNLFSCSSAPKRPSLTTRAMLLATKHLMNDILVKAYAQHAAILNAYGAHHLAAQISEMSLCFDSIEIVGDENVKQTNENTAIAIRNLALYEWMVLGNHETALSLLKKIRSHFSHYNRKIQMIFDQVVNEILFQRHIFKGDFESASNCVNLIRCINRNQALIMLAELRWRQNEPIAALECLDAVYMPNNSSTGNAQHSYSVSTLSGASFFRPNNLNLVNQILSNSNCLRTNESSVVVEQTNSSSTPKVQPKKPPVQPSKRIQSTPEPEEERPLTCDQDPYLVLKCDLLKATILSDLSALLECVLKAQAHGFKQLESKALLEVARVQGQVFGQYFDSQNIIDKMMVRLLSNGCLADIGNAYFLTATNHFYLYRNGVQRTTIHHTRSMNTANTSLTSASWANKRAISVFEHIQHFSSLLESIQLAALIEHEMGNILARNTFSKRARMLRVKLLKNNK